MEHRRSKTLLVSILSLGRPQNVLEQLVSMPAWLSTFSARHDILCHFVIRNNDPNVDFSTVAARLAEIEETTPGVTAALVTGGPNIGFGRGHNENFGLSASDYLLILNDDIGFPNFSWLDEAMVLLQSDARTACVGAAENPQYLNPNFGNGLFPESFHAEALKYAEASILLFDSGIFSGLGMFNDDLTWAMCEDADLSLRAQQFGYTIRWVSVPHQHWRSTSFNTLPGSVKSSILEHNRALLFANWGEALATGRIGACEVFDIWSDGIGDVFCCLPHLHAELSRYTAERRRHVVINTSHPELMEILPLDGVRVVSFKLIDDLRAHLGSAGISTLRTTRDVNFSLPMNIHTLLAGALAIPIADEAGMDRFATLLRGIRPLQAHTMRDYCVLHFEFKRTHDGRGLSPASVRDFVREAARRYPTVVAIGAERRLTPDICDGIKSKFVDLQGQLSVAQLLAVIIGATAFGGIDSFPAHVAQAAGVRSAVFFGAVHPLARVWDEAQLWPVVAELDCIGCYHTHLEPSVPFCMRRDQFCTTQAACENLTSTLDAMLEGIPFKWRSLRNRFQSLQARFVQFMRHHPAPPEWVMRPHGNSNEQLSTLIYRLTGQMSDLLRTQYQPAAIENLTNQVRQLQSDLFARDLRLESLRASSIAPALPEAAPEPRTQTTQLHTLPLEAVRCAVKVLDQWIQVDAQGSDPQLILPPLTGAGGKIGLRLSCDAVANETMQVLWDVDGEGFGEERMESVAISPIMSHAELSFDVAAGSVLKIRIDPSTEAMRTRLRGSLSGAFHLRGPAVTHLADDVTAAPGSALAPGVTTALAPGDATPTRQLAAKRTTAAAKIANKAA